jgi:hypothetical protein
MVEGEYTNNNVDYDTMFDNLEDLCTVQIPTSKPKVNLDQTRETLKEGAPTKGTFTSNFEHARQQAQYDNHKGMYDHIYVITESLPMRRESLTTCVSLDPSFTSSQAS